MKIKKTALALSLAALAGAASADVAHQTVAWADWTSGTAATIDFGGSSVAVSFSGSDLGLSTGTNYFSGYPNTYGTVVNAPTLPDLIRFNAGSQYTLNFSQAVVDPVIALVSVGQGSWPVSYQFSTPFIILSQGGNQWGGNDTGFTISGNTLVGREANGVIQFQGTYSSISWSTPENEFWHGITVGAVAAVPEPESYALMLAGLGLMGAVARRRSQRRG